MSRRPGESVQDWYERAIVNASVAAGLRENYAAGANANPAAFGAITQRVNETVADLEQARAALLVERESGRPAATS